MKRKYLLSLIAVVLILAVLGEFKTSIYGYCLDKDICKSPTLPGVDIRMQPGWIPETHQIDGSPNLSFLKGGRSIRDGAQVITFVHDAKSAKALANRLVGKSYGWGTGLVGTSDALKDFSPSSEMAYYLVVPEFNLLVVSNSLTAFDEIARVK